MVLVWESEGELLGVVVNLLDLLELEGDPVAVEGLLRLRENLLLNLVDRLLDVGFAVLGSGVVVASCAGGDGGNGAEEESVGRSRLCWSLSRVLAELLR